jgi:hypothetical protein
MLPVDTPQVVQQALDQVLEACSLFHAVTTTQPAEAGPSSAPEYLEKPGKVGGLPVVLHLPLCTSAVVPHAPLCSTLPSLGISVMCCVCHLLESS